MSEARDAVTQFALPLVVRVERVHPPGRTDALEAAARAVVTFLTDERASGDGGWADPVRAWTDGRIRKVVRRARGAEWRRAGALPGLTVTHRTAEVRVFPPVPLDGWPRDLAKLQVSGTDLDDPERPADPGAHEPVLWLNPELEMTAGKAMAQVGHAAQLGLAALTPDAREAWQEAGYPLAVRTASKQKWADLLGDGAVPVVRDAGFTEVAPGTCTAAAELAR
jgi:peptidyl-tRNA hydrolase